MAQQYYELSENPISLFTAPASSATYPTPTSYPTNSFAPLGTTNVKLEPPASSHTCGNSNIVKVGRSNKRQKIADEDGRHKFVSQKKWKFLDGQTWIPPKVSSKAQNASKIGVKSKQESITPERLLSPVDLASIPQSIPTTDSIQLPCNDELAQHEPLTLSGFEGSLKQISSSLAGRKPQQHHVASTNQRIQLQPSLQKSPSRQVPDVDPEQQTENEDSRNPVLPTSIRSPEADILTNQPRVSKSIPALSLEKDAERIAALIAQKRMENESNMFRERMLQRQQEHKTHKDLNKDNETSQEILPKKTPISSPPGGRGRYHDTHGKPSSSVISLPASPENSRSSGSPVTTAQVQDQRFESPTVYSNIGPYAPQRAAFEQQETMTDMVANYTVTSRAASSSRYPKSKGSHGIHAISKATTNPGFIEHMTTIASGPRTSEIAQGNVSLGVEDVGLGLQSASPSRLTPTENGCNIIPGSGRPIQDAHLQQYGRQRSTHSRLPTLMSQRALSTGPISSECTRISSTSLVSPPGSSYLQSPMNMAAHHFSHLGLSPSYSSQTATVNVPPARQHGHLWTKQASVSSTNHPATTRHTWQSGNHQNGHLGMVNYISPQNLPSEQGVANTTPATSTQVQQVEPPTSVLRPDPNRFGGNARTETSGDKGLAPPKPRVNMFSNPKGAPFPMEEVIRQIEMT